MNRQQRRALSRARKPGQSFAQAVGARQMIKEAVEWKVHDEAVDLECDIVIQRFMWECVVVLAEEFGFGRERSIRFLQGIEKLIHEVDAMADENGTQYAIEKVRQRAEQITGIKLSYIHEKEMIEAKKYAESQGVYFPPDEDFGG